MGAQDPAAAGRQDRGARREVAAGVAVERALREHWGRLLALLTRLVGSLDVAEEALQDAYATALTAWERDGVPDRPDAWLLTAARRRARDRFRREATLARKLPLLVVPEVQDGPDAAVEAGGEEMSTIPDERLQLLFTCCHPALAVEARVALTLRLLGGLTTAQIAHGFLVPEATMAARLTRAKNPMRTTARLIGNSAVAGDGANATSGRLMA